MDGKVQKEKLSDFNLSPDEILRYWKRVVMPKDEMLRKKREEKLHFPAMISCSNKRGNMFAPQTLEISLERSLEGRTFLSFLVAFLLGFDRKMR